MNNNLNINTESYNFINSYLNESERRLDELQYFFNSDKYDNIDTFTFLSILSEILISKDCKLTSFFDNFKNKFSDDNNFNSFKKIILDNEDKILRLNKEIDKNKFSEVTLVDINWKLIGSTTIDNTENFKFIPRILLRLVFSNNTTRVLECDFANFNKLQEEIDFICQSFNSTYSRKLLSFSK